MTPANNLLPINNATISNFPVSFSWNLVANAQYYDFYLWLSTGSVPTTPTIANLSQINFAYSGQLQYGSTYKWKIVAKFGACTSESAIQQFSTRLLPDLIVDSVTVPITATSESDITVKWRVKNQGLGSTVSGWNDYAYFSDYPGFVWGGNAVLIASPGNFSSLSPGTTYTSNSFTYHIPVGYQGTYYVFVKTNAYGQEAEITDTNNTRISIPITVTLAPPPDLKVDSLVVSPTTVFSASQLNVKFNIKNAGTVPTNASSWTDNIYLSQDAVFNSNNATLLQTNYHNGTLAVSGYYKVNATVTLPQYIGGTYYIHVVTDAANNVFENSNENNNTTTSSPITVVLLPTPNLTVKNLTILNDTASNNQGINLQWTTVNEGAITAKPSWAENVYLSADTIFNESSDPVFGNAYRQDSIISLAANTIQINKNVPYNTPEGNYYFFVKTDVNNSIFETAAGELDNVSKYAGSIRIVNADLVPTLFTTPSTATSEQTITVSWNVSNATRATIYSNGWYDKVYLSTDNAISSGDIVLSNVLINTFIGPNGNYISQATFTIPVGISGSYFLILKADDGDAVFEKNESNNTLSKAIAITLAPWADLKVTSVTPPSRDTVGTFINFSYTEQNISTGVLQNRTWNDAVYLSPTATLNDPNAILLGNINQAGRTLNASQSFTQSASLYLPTSIDSGTYYLLVVADANNSIFENTGENNNRTVSSAILIKKLTVIVVVNHTPHVDLAVISGKVTDTSVTAGKPVNLQWTVKNVSDSSTTVTPWTDAVYLSNDSVLNSGDQLLGTFGVNGPLVSHATYTQNVSVVVPQNASGTLYFIVTADNGNVHNDTNRINNNLVLKNNVGGNVIVIIVPPPCDLIPLSITTPPKIYNGQPVKVKFSVKNNGTGVTPAKTWKDRFYLSTNTVLDAGDILIGTSTRNDSLQAGAQYTDSVMANIPATFSGNYILIIKTDADDNVYEPNDNNNVAFSGINITQQSPSDLIVAGITTPVGTQISGSNISVNWNLKNVGPNPAIGYLKEAVYLSKDSILDGNDVLFGTTESTINLPSLGLENHVLAATLNNVSVGDYYVIVRTDLLNNIVELSDSNNVTISTSLLNVNVKELILNVVKTDSIKGSSPLTYRIEIPAGLKDETLSVKLTGDSVNNPANRLYLSYNTIPSANSFDFASLVPFQSKQEAIVPALKQGTYYLTGLGPVASADTQKVTLLAKIIPFSITDVDAKQGGNTGSVTVKISGAKFETNTLFKLAAGGNEIIADHLTYVNSTTVFATFNLIGKSLGFYTAKAVNSVGTVTQLANAFEIVTGSPGGGLPGSGFTCSIDNVGFDNNFEVTDQHPRTARTNTTATITIIFRNTGNVDIPIQRRVFTSPKQVYINFAQSYTDSLNNVLLECKEAGGPPDILRPGAIGYIKVYARIVGGAHEIINFLVNE